MRHSILMVLIFISISIFAQHNSKFSYETGLGIAWEGDYGMIGLNQYNTLNYNFSNLFTLSSNLGFFQSTNFPNDFSSNASSILCDLNLNYNALKNNKSSLILGAGLTYFKGALSYDEGTLINPIQRVTYYNNIGINAVLKYKYRISERWSGNIALRTYFQDPTVFIATFSSITYGLTYSF